MEKHYLTKEKDLVIYQKPGVATFTFDSILLARFSSIKKGTIKIADLCSGNGAVSMLLTKKLLDDVKVKIIQVEIQEEVAELASKSIKKNKLEKIVTVLQDDVKGINEKIGFQKFNLVVCNPPYFIYDEQKNLRDSKSQQIARHEIMIKLDDVVKEANKLLTNGGYFTMIHRPERLSDIVSCLIKYNLELKKIQFVHPRRSEVANTLLIEARKGSAGGRVDICPPIFVYEENSTTLSDEAKNIYF